VSERLLFTPASANRTLPLVRGVVADILELGRELRALHASSGEGNGFEKRRAQAIRSAETQLKSLLGELESIGCSYRDWNFEIGLVDFPAIIDGEEVSLCWRSDEDAVLWYHGVDAGYAGRRPIPDHLLAKDPP
jgi:hypothetical protein